MTSVDTERQWRSFVDTIGSVLGQDHGDVVRFQPIKSAHASGLAPFLKPRAGLVRKRKTPA